MIIQELFTEKEEEEEDDINYKDSYNEESFLNEDDY